MRPAGLKPAATGRAGMIALTASVASDKGALQLTFAPGRILLGAQANMPVFQLRRSHAFLWRHASRVLVSASSPKRNFPVWIPVRTHKFLAFRQSPYNSTTPPLNTPSFQDPMELNHILLFTAIATAALVVLKLSSRKVPAPAPRVCRRPDRIRFGLAAGTPNRRVALRHCLVRAVGRPCSSSEPRVGGTLPITAQSGSDRGSAISSVARCSRTNYR